MEKIKEESSYEKFLRMKSAFELVSVSELEKVAKEYWCEKGRGGVYPDELDMFIAGFSYYHQYNSPVAPPHEDKGAEEEFEKLFLVNGHRFGEAVNWKDVFNWSVEHASNERNRILKIAESISFNTEDQAGNKFVAVDLEELREKLKT